MQTDILINKLEIESPFEKKEIKKIYCKLFSDVLKDKNFREMNLEGKFIEDKKIIFDINHFKNEDLQFLKNNMMMMDIKFELVNEKIVDIKKLLFIDLENGNIKFILLK